MNREEQAQDTGRDLGYEGVERLVDHVDRYCSHERRRIELRNESGILRARLELAAWAEQERSLGDRLRLAPPPGDRRTRVRRAWFARAIVALLTLGGFFFTLLAFDPFRLGWKGVLYSLGIAIVAPFCMGRLLEEWNTQRLLKAVITLSCAAAITSSVMLAVVRGDLFSQQLKDFEAPVLVDGDALPAQQSGNTFYEESFPILRIMMALLALAMELGAGLAADDARRFGSDSGEDPEGLARELIDTRMRIASGASHICELENEGAVFEARFWRDFYHAMLTHTSRKAIGKLLMLLVFVGLFGLLPARAGEPRVNLVVAIDLSASVAVRGPDGKTEFQKNIAGVTSLLAALPAGAKVTVIGISGDSFGQPDILLTAEVTKDPGYFGERLRTARRQLVQGWHDRSAHLEPNANRTDILGALALADQIFQETPNDARKMLVIYSDMRHDTPRLNLKRLTNLSVQGSLYRVAVARLVPDFTGVEVSVLGVDGAGEDFSYWNCLQQFWVGYFGLARANVQSYSALRRLPNL